MLEIRALEQKEFFFYFITSLYNETRRTESPPRETQALTPYPVHRDDLYPPTSDQVLLERAG